VVLPNQAVAVTVAKKLAEMQAEGPDLDSKEKMEVWVAESEDTPRPYRLRE